MENERIINLESTNADHCLLRFVAPPAHTSTVLLIYIPEETKRKMVIGLYLTFSIIAIAGIIAGTISYLIRRRRRNAVAPLKPMRAFENYTADDVDCLHYAYRSHLYFKFLNSSSGPSIKRCTMCEREDDHDVLLGIAKNLSDRAKRLGRSTKVEELIAKGRRLKHSDKIPEYVDPRAPLELKPGVANVDVNGMEGGLQGHTCVWAHRVRKGSLGEGEDLERLRAWSERSAGVSDMQDRLQGAEGGEVIATAKLQRPRLRPRRSEGGSFSTVDSGGFEG